MTDFRSKAGKTLFLACAALALAACGGGGDSRSNTGTLKLGITDAPVDAAEAVVVQFTGVELKPVGGQAFAVDFAAPKSLDLIALQGTTRAMLLDGEQVPAGDYEWMRLKVNADPNVADDSYITINGARCEMRIPSGDETGLKMIRGFTVGVGTITDFTVDFDLRKSVVQPPGQRTDLPSCDGQAYLLKPVLRVVDSLQVGTISGTIDANLIGAGACATSSVTPGNVYLFGPYTATDPVPVPDDVDGIATDGADPLTTAMVDPNTHAYTIGFVPAGNYVLAYTCDADASTVDADTDVPTPPATDEVVTFTPAAGTQATVMANQTTTVDFDLVPAP
jgi:hypothetical protein